VVVLVVVVVVVGGGGGKTYHPRLVCRSAIRGCISRAAAASVLSVSSVCLFVVC